MDNEKYHVPEQVNQQWTYSPVLSKKWLLRDMLVEIGGYKPFLPIGNSLCIQISLGETDSTWQSRIVGQLLKRSSKCKAQQ